MLRGVSLLHSLTLTFTEQLLCQHSWQSLEIQRWMKHSPWLWETHVPSIQIHGVRHVSSKITTQCSVIYCFSTIQSEWQWNVTTEIRLEKGTVDLDWASCGTLFIGSDLESLLKDKEINQAKGGKVLSKQSSELLHLRMYFEPGSVWLGSLFCFSAPSAARMPALEIPKLPGPVCLWGSGNGSSLDGKPHFQEAG